MSAPILLNLSHEQNIMREMVLNRVPFPLFVGGYGAGKSFTLVVNAVQDVLSFRGCRVACYAPTYDLMNKNIVPAIIEYLDQLGIKHSPCNKQTHTITINGVEGWEIIFRPFLDPAKIVGYECYSSHFDELDVARQDKAAEAWRAIVGRNRQQHPDYGDKTLNVIAAYTTPESFQFTYERWGKEHRAVSAVKGYEYIVAPTWSNPRCSIGYVKNMINTYTPEQQMAYLKGIWTNIATGTVYSRFSKTKNITDRVIQKGDILRIGQDFNNYGCCGAVYVIDNVPGGDDIFSQVDEFAVDDTESIVEHVKSSYQGHRVIFYPDASGAHGSTNASQSDIAILRDAGYEVMCNSTNPLIVDRVNAVQRGFYRDWLFINPETCPESVDARLQHAYSKLTNKPEKFKQPGSVDDRNDAADYPIAFLNPIRGRGEKPKTIVVMR